MSIEKVVQGIVDSVGLNIENVSVSSQEEGMKRIVALMTQAGEDVSRRAEWSRSFKSVDIPANATEFDLPSDFQKMIDSGAIVIKGAGFSPVRVIVDPATWGFLSTVGSDQHYCHISGNKLLFNPNTGYTGATLNYVSTNWLYEGDTLSSVITSDTQTPIFPDHLLSLGTLWRYNRMVGLPFDDLAAEFEANYTTALHSDRGTK